MDSMFGRKGMVMLLFGLLFGIILSVPITGSSSGVVVVLNHWSRNREDGVLSPANETDSINMNNQSIDWADLSGYAGDNMSWDAASMEFDVSADGTSKWNLVGDVLFPKNSGANIWSNDSVNAEGGYYSNGSVVLSAGNRIVFFDADNPFLDAYMGLTGFTPRKWEFVTERDLSWSCDDLSFIGDELVFAANDTIFQLDDPSAILQFALQYGGKMRFDAFDYLFNVEIGGSYGGVGDFLIYGENNPIVYIPSEGSIPIIFNKSLLLNSFLNISGKSVNANNTDAYFDSVYVDGVELSAGTAGQWNLSGDTVYPKNDYNVQVNNTQSFYNASSGKRVDMYMGADGCFHWDIYSGV